MHPQPYPTYAAETQDPASTIASPLLPTGPLQTYTRPVGVTRDAMTRLTSWGMWRPAAEQCFRDISCYCGRDLLLSSNHPPWCKNCTPIPVIVSLLYDPVLLVIANLTREGLKTPCQRWRTPVVYCSSISPLSVTSPQIPFQTLPLSHVVRVDTSHLRLD